MSKFSQRVKVLRLNKNLSLRQLSKLTGISPSAIHSYETGVREASYSSLEALSDVFNCDIDYLLGKTDVKNSIANALGYESLHDAYLNSALPEQRLSDFKKALLELADYIPEEQQQNFLELAKIYANSLKKG